MYEPMSNFTILMVAISGIAAGILSVGTHKLKYKKSIVFNIAAIMLLPILVGCVVGLFIGARGVIHFAWGAPVIIIVCNICYAVIARMLQRPMNEMIKTVRSLSDGDVDVDVSENLQKGEHEMAQVMRLLKKLTGSLKNIAAFANHVGKGNLNVEYALLSEKDSLGQSMLDMRGNLQKAEAEKDARYREDERRNWVTQGIAKFADLLRTNNDNIEELCNLVISNMVKYIGANQAGIFILNDDDPQNPVLELKACYAYERRKFLQKTIKMGEGLVGACFLERETVYMTRFPKDYINITSGLGGDTPCALLIVPLKVNDEVYGVVEIAAFKAFEPHVREFVEKVSESIASTIGTVKVNMHTNKLLEQTKLQAEEMLNQEEELRQNMEEMQATQEEMRRREAELGETLEKMKEAKTDAEEKDHEMQQFFNAFKDSSHLIIYSSEGVLTDINDKLLHFFNATDKSAFIGRHMSEYLGEETCRKVMEHLAKGETHEEYQSVDTGVGGVINFRQKFIPICNKQGKLSWILLLTEPERD